MGPVQHVPVLQRCGAPEEPLIMRQIKTVSLELSSEYPKKEQFTLDIVKGGIIQLESNTFYTPPVKLPYNGTIPVIQRYFEYGPDNINIMINNDTITISHEYDQSRSLIVNFYGEDEFINAAAMIPVVVDMSKVTSVMLGNNILGVSTYVSGYNVRIHYPGRNYGSSFYPERFTTKDDYGKETTYYTSILKFSANYDSDHNVTSYDVTVPRYATNYI